MLKSVFMVAVVAATTEESCGDRLNASQAQFPPAVGSKMLHEDARQVIWDLSIAAGERCAVHEHVYDYSFHVLEASTLAVYSGETAEHLFSFDTVVGETKAFERRGTLMYDRAGLLPPFDAVHGVANVGSATYREILVESKPCPNLADVSADPRDPRRKRRVALVRRDAEFQQPSAWDADGATAVVVGARANHASEVAFANGYTHCILVDAAHPAFAAVDKELDAASLVFDYTPIVAVDKRTGESPPSELRHVFFAKFKVDAPVGDLVAGYAALPAVIPEMRRFEWGPVDMAQADSDRNRGFEYIFVTTFDDAKARDRYLVHPEHDAYVKRIIAHIAELTVLDYVVHN